MSNIKLGINEYMSDEIYHDDREFISSSGVKLMLKNPRLFHRNYVLNAEEKKQNVAFDFGHYVHSLVLEPDTVEAKYVIYEGATRRGKVWEAFKEAAGDKTIITASQKRMADQMIAVYDEAKVVIGSHGYEEPTALSSFFKKGKPEITIGTMLEDVKVKVRFDYHREFTDFASIQDLKTTGMTANTQKEAESICDSWDYDLSAALYTDVATKVLKKPHDFYFVFMSKSDMQANIYKASKEMLERGRLKYMEGLSALKEARSTGAYFSNSITELR